MRKEDQEVKNQISVFIPSITKPSKYLKLIINTYMNLCTHSIINPYEFQPTSTILTNLVFLGLLLLTDLPQIQNLNSQLKIICRSFPTTVC